MIDYADKDRDGAISYEEFVNVVTKVYPKVWSIRLHNKINLMTIIQQQK